jgi:hypothetical protein
MVYPGMVYPGTPFHRRQRGIPMHPYGNRSQIRALALSPRLLLLPSRGGEAPLACWRAAAVRDAAGEGGGDCAAWETLPPRLLLLTSIGLHG